MDLLEVRKNSLVDQDLCTLTISVHLRGNIINVGTQVSHIAFSDDSAHVDGRFKSLAFVSFNYSCYEQIQASLEKILRDSDITSEFKWEKVRTAKYRYAAKSLIDFAFKNCDKLRVDILTWDLMDSRHEGIVGRDDAENLVRMYYHLVSWTISKRWPVKNAIWDWYPDVQSDVDWSTLRNCLRNKKHKCVRDLFNLNPKFQNVSVRNITPSSSKDFASIQLADLFAGIGSYSKGHFNKFQIWKTNEMGQRLLFPTSEPLVLSASEKERFVIIDYFDKKAKDFQLQIGLTRTRGFRSFRPEKFVNFWYYRPQHHLDSAPIKGA